METVVKFEIFRFNARNANLIGLRCQNVFLCIFLEVPLYLQNYFLRFFHQGLIGHFGLCRKLRNKQIVKYVPCIAILKGRNWQKVRFVVAILSSETHFFSKTTECISGIKVSLKNFAFSKNTLGSVPCFGALIFYNARKCRKHW